MNQILTHRTARPAAEVSINAFQESVREFGEFVESVESSYSSRRAILIPLLSLGSAFLIAIAILALVWQALR